MERLKGSKIKVYRVENEAGEGPYTASLSPGLNARSSSRHPTIQEEGQFLIDLYVFGFESLEALQNWFNAVSLYTLEGHTSDWRITAYSVPLADTVIAEKQLTFDRDFAECLERIEIQSLLQTS